MKLHGLLISMRRQAAQTVATIMLICCGVALLGRQFNTALRALPSELYSCCCALPLLICALLDRSS